MVENRERWPWMTEELAQLKQSSQFRSLSSSISLGNGWIAKEGKKLLNLCSNHYLGLDLRLDGETVRQLEQEARQLDSGLFAGATASRLIVGNDPVFARFESELAQFKGTPGSLLFSSGYMANLGIISALVGRNDLVFSDRLNHASIVDGIALSRAEQFRYRHRDPDHLETLLRRADPSKKKLIVSDAIFSMDGSIAPLQELVELKNRYNTMLMVDEAHSGGIYGAQGQGLVYALGLTEQVDIQMGTFSKAYGGYGAYAAGDQQLIDYLINKARSFIYTTALPPLTVHCVRHNWLRAKREEWRRKRLLAAAERFRGRLQTLGFATGESECQIVPVIVGDNKKTVRFSGRLLDEGIAASAIRPPTVPEGTSRIRLTLMATHDEEDLDWALNVMEKVGKEMGIV